MRKRFEVLDSFRGIFAICVVFFHARYLGSVTETDFFRGSSTFVDFFFILSGFVLTHSYAYNENLKFKMFFISRTFRLFPLHFATLIIYVLLEIGKMFAGSYGFVFNRQAFSSETDLIELLPNFFLLQSWFESFNTLSFNFVSWTISLEYYIYMIFFVSLFTKGAFRYGLWLIVVLFASNLLENNFINESVKYGVLNFFIGCFTYVFYRCCVINNKLNFKEQLVTIVEVVLVIMVFLTISGYIAIPKYLLFVVSIFLFASEKGKMSTFFKMNFFSFLGKLSYSIYMVHPIVLFCATSITMILSKVFGVGAAPMIEGARFVDYGSPLINNIMLLIAVMMVILFSHITYKYIELPGQKIGKKILNNN